MTVHLNLVLVTSHDTGRRLGCYGARVRIPILDTLATSGFRFAKAVSTAPQGSPSRSSALSGRYPHQNLAHNGQRPHQTKMCLPALRRRSGYDAYLFSFQHEADDPRQVCSSKGCHRVRLRRRQPAEEMGRAAASLPFSVLEGEKIVEQRRLVLRWWCVSVPSVGERTLLCSAKLVPIRPNGTLQDPCLEPTSGVSDKPSVNMPLARGGKTTPVVPPTTCERHSSPKDLASGFGL